MAYSIKDVVTQITNDFSTVEFDLAENRITLEQYQERLQNSRLLVFIENLLLLTPEAALISFQKQCNSGAQIPEDYKHKILAALKDRITLFYTDDLAVLVNAIPQDLPLKETCEALGKCYDDLFIKHEQLKAIGFIFESHYKTMFIDNSKNDKPNPEYLNPKIFEHVQKYNLFDIDLYISPKTQEIINKKYSHKINEIIEAVNSIDIINPMEQSGGFIDEYHKYVKYKAKYMNKKYGHNIKQITKSMIKNKSQDGIDVHSKYVKYKTKYLNERNDDE